MSFRDFDKIPRKLLDCPEMETGWPESFRLVGTADLIEYSTQIHSGREWQPYVHRFASGVTVFAPEDRGGVSLNEAYSPIVMGVADGLYLSSDYGHHAYLRDGAELDEADFELAGQLGELMAWDVEGRQLLIANEHGDVEFVLCDGLLELSDDGMISG